MYNDAIYTGSSDDPYLAHYGVIGMRWGIRRDPQRAYDRAVKKRSRIRKKTEKYAQKAYKNKAKANAVRPSFLQSMLMGENWVNDRRNAEYGYLSRANMYEVKANRMTRKGERWIKSMRKEFKGITLDSIEREDLYKIAVRSDGEIRDPDD